jgi:hypothetical protein
MDNPHHESGVNTSDLCFSELSLKQVEGESQKVQIKGLKYFVYSTRFWQYLAIMVLSNYFGTFFSYTYKTFGENDSPHDQISDKTLTWAASVGSGLVNGCSRVAFGTLVDKYSFRTLMSILMTIQLANSMLCFWAAYVPALYFICVLVNYMVIGGIFATFPVSVQNCFGLEFGPQIYVQILFGSFISSLMNLVTTKYLLPATSFVLIVYVGSLFQVASLGCLYFFSEELDVKNLAKRDGLKFVKTK